MTGPPGGHRESAGAETCDARGPSAVTLNTREVLRESGCAFFSVSVNGYFRVISLKAGVTPPKGLWSTTVFWERSLATLK